MDEINELKDAVQNIIQAKRGAEAERDKAKLFAKEIIGVNEKIVGELNQKVARKYRKKSASSTKPTQQFLIYQS